MKKKITLTICVALLLSLLGGGTVFATGAESDTSKEAPDTTTSAPATSAPDASEPITSAPTTSEPITSAPTSSDPTTSMPVAEAPEIDDAVPEKLPEIPKTPTGDGIISIDGYFDDWDDKPKTELYYDNSSTDRKTFISVIADETNIYCYGTIAKHYESSNFVLTIDGREFRFEGHYMGGGNLKDPGVYNVVLRNNAWNIIGDGIVHIRPEGQNHEMEFRISFAKLGLNPATVKEIKLRNPSYGRGEAINVGTPTGPILSLCALGACVGIGGYQFKKNKRKKESC